MGPVESRRDDDKWCDGRWHVWHQDESWGNAGYFIYRVLKKGDTSNGQFYPALDGVGLRRRHLLADLGHAILMCDVLNARDG